MLYQAVFWTIDAEALLGCKTHLATTLLFKGVPALKYVHDCYGPGSATQQVCRTIDIITERQTDGETGQEWGARLQSMNASVTESIPDADFKQILQLPDLVDEQGYPLQTRGESKNYPGWCRRVAALASSRAAHKQL